MIHAQKWKDELVLSQKWKDGIIFFFELIEVKPKSKHLGLDKMFWFVFKVSAEDYFSLGYSGDGIYPFYGCEHSFCILVCCYRLPRKIFQCTWTEPMNFPFPLSVLFQTEISWCPTHCVLFKGARCYIKFQLQKNTDFHVLKLGFPWQNRLHKFFIFHAGALTDLLLSTVCCGSLRAPPFHYASSY